MIEWRDQDVQYAVRVQQVAFQAAVCAKLVGSWVVSVRVTQKNLFREVDY